MLRRDRQIRTQIQQLMDAALFALSFWLAYKLRANADLIDLFNLAPIDPFESYSWLYLILIPVAPLVLEAQGFYQRPLLCPRRTTAWLLFKACLFVSLGLILGLFLYRMIIARWVVVWFGFISFGVVIVKQELIQWSRHSRIGREQFRRRVVLVATQEEARRMKAELEAKSPEEVEVLATLDLNEFPVTRLVELLHEHSVNGVILSAKHAYLEQVEAAIRACELEGVETWLIADFFRTQISRTSFYDFFEIG